MQGLVYIFIVLAAAGLGVAAYFGLTFSPIEAFVTALSLAAVVILIVERQVRLRSEARLHKAIEDMARLLSTDAKAGQVLSQRVNALADFNIGQRLDSMEADISVLGTVVRQVAETVAEMEAGRMAAKAPQPARAEPLRSEVPAPSPEEADLLPEPLIPLPQLLAALERNRLVFHIEPVIQLPSRRIAHHDLVPRLTLEDGSIAERADFAPQRGGEDVLRRLDLMGLDEAITLSRRSATTLNPLRLCVGIERVSLNDRRTLDQILATLVANEAVAPGLKFIFDFAQWRYFTAAEKRLVGEIRKTGVGFVLASATTLRLDFSELEGLGFSTVRIDATRFLRQPVSYSDFHTSDISPYVKRFNIELCATGVLDEQQVLSLYEDGIALAQGPHIGRPTSVRSDLTGFRPGLNRAQAV